MIRDKKAWQQFEAEWQRSQEPNLEANLRVFEVLIERARVGGLASGRPVRGHRK